MNLVEIESSEFQIVAVTDGHGCPLLDFLASGEDDSAANGFANILAHVAELGLDGVPSAWLHEASKELKIYRFRKGDYRLFFFKGEGRQIAVCTTVSRKRGDKSDKAAVRLAASYRSEYLLAVQNRTLRMVEYGEE